MTPEAFQHPIDNIVWRIAADLDPCGYNPNRVHRAELRLLERSLLSTGWVQPLMVNRDDIIIDGFHRWRLAQDSDALKARDRGRVPTAVLDVDRPTAMMMTIRMNRAKGTHVAVHMASIVQELVNVHGMDPQQVAVELGATMDEVNVLMAEGVFAAKGIADWAYSKAWYPAEEKK